MFIIVANTRHAERLHMHPYPVHPVECTVSGTQLPIAPESFCGRMFSLWNSLVLPDQAYGSLKFFRNAIDSVRWRDLARVISHYTTEQNDCFWISGIFIMFLSGFVLLFFRVLNSF